MDDFRLARPRARDREAWAGLWRDYLAFYGATRDAATYDAAFAQLLSNDPQAFQGLLAWSGATALGLVHWVWHPHMWRPEGIYYLQDLFVASEARGTGRRPAAHPSGLRCGRHSRRAGRLLADPGGQRDRPAPL